MSTQSDRIIAALNERLATAEAKLAAANKLLERVHDTLARLGLQWVDAPVPLIVDIRAHLAAQHASAPARTEHPMTPPYAVLCDESIVPLMNCPECKEMGRADMAHYHVCPRVVTSADMRVLDATSRLSLEELQALASKGNNEQDIASAELARREGK